jgi:hypothetical protein
MMIIHLIKGEIIYLGRISQCLSLSFNINLQAMLKIFIQSIAVIIIATSANGQIDSIENIMTKRQLTCSDIYYNATYLIPHFYNKGAIDSAQAVIHYWEKECGQYELSIRCKILLAIRNHSFSEDLYDSTIINALLFYKQSRDTIGYYEYYKSELDTFTVDKSKQLLSNKDLTEVEKFFLRFYSNDFENTFGMLQGENFNGTKIQQYYLKAIKQNKNQVSIHLAILTGAWIPLGNLNTVGSHPYLGFRLGIKYWRLYADVALGFKFIKSPNTYQVYENDSLYDTEHFFGGYFALELGYELFSVKNSHFDLIGGVGYDGFDALKVDYPNTNDDLSKSINALNINIGLGYKYFKNQGGYFGIEGKYNFVNYKNPLGTNLSGDVITINLIFGGIGNRYYPVTLKVLDYTY